MGLVYTSLHTLKLTAIREDYPQIGYLCDDGQTNRHAAFYEVWRHYKTGGETAGFGMRG